MEELEFLKKHILKRVSMTQQEVTQLASAFTLKRVKKKQFLIQPDFITKHRTFVLKGALRSYVIDPEGVDHTIQFAVEDWWISDINSYIYQKPATMFVVAIEDCHVLQITYEMEMQFKEANHKFETFFRIAAERTAAYHQRRIIATLTRTAEERYSDFTDTYPALVNRLPQYVLASYLGMTTQFLSRIRNAGTKKQ